MVKRVQYNSKEEAVAAIKRVVERKRIWIEAEREKYQETHPNEIIPA